MQVVLNQEYLVAQIHQNIFFLTTVPSFVFLRLYHTCFDKLWFSNYLETVRWIDRREYYFWNISIAAAKALVKVRTRDKLMLIVIFDSHIAFLWVLSLFSGRDDMAKLARPLISALQLV